MMRQTLAIFLDAYREMNNKRMFWFVLILSGVALGGFAGLGIHGRTLTIFGFELPRWWGDATVLYKYAFVYLIGIWLTWGAMILALISVSSMYPDFISNGSIELYLSRPISRLRLFLTKYIAGLTFVFLQLVVFSVCSYLVLGIRGHLWRTSVFLAIPIELCFFSYLYCLNVLFGVWTRSTMPTLLLTLVAWFLIWGVQQAELTVFEANLMNQQQIEQQQAVIERSDRLIATLTHPTTQAAVATSPAIVNNQQRLRSSAVAELKDLQDRSRTYQIVHRIFYGIETIIPKTKATNDLLDRHLLSDADISMFLSPELARNERQARRRSADLEATMVMRNRSLTWILGTSLGFELVIVGLGAWIFCRRDY